MQKLLARLERRFGRYAPEGIILWLVALSGILHLIVFAKPEAVSFLWLDPDAVLRGEIWRAFTFLFAPAGPMTTTGLFWTALGLWFLHTMGSALEAQWGSFRFDVYFFLETVLLVESLHCCFNFSLALKHERQVVPLLDALARHEVTVATLPPSLLAVLPRAFTLANHRQGK